MDYDQLVGLRRDRIKASKKTPVVRIAIAAFIAAMIGALLLASVNAIIIMLLLGYLHQTWAFVPAFGFFDSWALALLVRFLSPSSITAKTSG